MATFKGEISKGEQKQDGTWVVKIRITHNRHTKRIKTNIFVTKDDLKRSSSEIKTQKIKDKIEELVKEYRTRCNFNDRIGLMTVDEVVDFITKKEITDDIDFIEFGNAYVQKLKKDGKEGTSENYNAALSSLIRFKNRKTIYIKEITVSFLQDFVEFLINEAAKRYKIQSNNRRVPRAVSLYCGCIRHLHNEAKLKYNDEDNNIVRIPGSPFSRFKIPKEDTPEQRVLTLEQLRALFDLPYTMNKMTREEKATPIQERTETVKECRFNLSKDVFILSFGLIGMNSADLFSCTQIKNDKITYQRQKTASRREDNAEFCVHINPIIKELFEKYKDPTKKYVFRFYKMYANKGTFNAAINKGLKEVAKTLNVRYGNEFIDEGLEFYAARLTWATLAANEVGIDEYTVHKALNHIEDKMKITERYIIKNFSKVNDANDRVLKYVFEVK